MQIHRQTIVHVHKPITTFLRVLLLDIKLRTTLLCLSHVMLLLSTQLRLAVTRDTSYSTTKSARDAVGDAIAEVIELSLGFLAFAFSVLLGACALEVLFQEPSVSNLHWLLGRN
jgi:hypothetical protein